MFWPSGENEEEAGRAKGRLVWKPRPHYWPQIVATEDFLQGRSVLHNPQPWHKTIVSTTVFTYIITKSSKQPLVGVIVLIWQIMELKLREVA